MVLKLCSQENPQRTKKKFQKIKYRTKNGAKMWFRTIFGSIKNLFWFSFLEPLQEVLKKKEFFIEPSEMILGNLKSQKGSLLNQNIQKVSLNNVLQCIIMGKNGQTSKAMSRGKMTKSNGTRASVFHKAQISVDNPGKFYALFQEHLTSLGQWFFTSSLVEIGHSISINKKIAPRS